MQLIAWRIYYLAKEDDTYSRCGIWWRPLCLEWDIQKIEKNTPRMIKRWNKCKSWNKEKLIRLRISWTLNNLIQLKLMACYFWVLGLTLYHWTKYIDKSIMFATYPFHIVGNRVNVNLSSQYDDLDVRGRTQPNVYWKNLIHIGVIIEEFGTTSPCCWKQRW